MVIFRLLLGSLSLILLAACAGQNAREDAQAFTVGAGVGTMGIYVEPTLKTGPKSSLRMPIGFGKRKFSTSFEGIDYDVSGSVGGVGVLADYYPAGGALRVSGGLFKTDLNVSGRTTGSVEVGENTYVGVDLSTRGGPSNSVAPVLSVGYDGHVGAGWGVSTDVGVMYVGGWTTSITDATGTIAQSDIDAELQAVDEQLSDINILPFVKFGATYRW